MTMRPEVASWLDTCSYPDTVVQCVEEVTSWIDNHLPISRILLLGSTARGELSWRRLDHDIDVFSDLEFYLITRRPLTESESRALSTVRGEWGRRWRYPGPFFHIDISMNPEALFWRKIRFDRRIATFELLSTGKVLSGAEFDREQVLFGVSQLDLGNTNELVLVRLWMQLLYTPIRLVLGGADDYERLVFKYALCRNTLEVLTILLPNVGVLLPSYQQRAEYFQSHTELHGLLPDGAAQAQATCLDAKLHVAAPEAWPSYFGEFLRQYMRLLGFLTANGLEPAAPSWGHVDSACERVMASRGRFMNDHWLPKLRRLRREMRLYRHYSRTLAPAVARRWLRESRRCLALCFLLRLHYALYEMLLEGRTESLPGIAQLLATLHPSFTGTLPTGTQAEHWLHLRSAFIEFMSWWQYNDVQYLEKWGIAEWTHERG
jgi:hypothetical protein